MSCSSSGNMPQPSRGALHGLQCRRLLPMFPPQAAGESLLWCLNHLLPSFSSFPHLSGLLLLLFFLPPHCLCSFFFPLANNLQGTPVASCALRWVVGSGWNQLEPAGTGCVQLEPAVSGWDSPGWIWLDGLDPVGSGWGSPGLPSWSRHCWGLAPALSY